MTRILFSTTLFVPLASLLLAFTTLLGKAQPPTNIPEVTLFTRPQATTYFSVKLVPGATKLWLDLGQGQQNEITIGEGENYDLAVTPVQSKAIVYGEFESFTASGQDIYSLEMQRMATLKELSITNSSLTLLSLAGCSSLATLNLSHNNLTELLLSETPSLVALDVSSNGLEALDCSQCTKLVKLLCNKNQLSNVNVVRCDQLEELDISSNKKLTKIELKNMPSLKGLTAFSTSLAELDVSGCRELQFIDTSFVPLKRLRARDCERLITLTCYKNDLRSVDIRGCSSLQTASFQQNPKLFRLDVSDCTNLQKLLCSTCGLRELLLGDKPKLAELWCIGNKLTSLDISQAPNLLELQCEDNELQSLKLPTKLTRLNFVAIARNQLSPCALDSVCDLLPDYSRDGPSAQLRLVGNPGTATCRSQVAVDKKWMVDHIGDGTGCPERNATNELSLEDWSIQATAKGVEFSRDRFSEELFIYTIDGSLIHYFAAHSSLPNAIYLPTGSYIIAIGSYSKILVIPSNQ